MMLVDQSLIDDVINTEIEINFAPFIGLAFVALYITVWIWGRQDN